MMNDICNVVLHRHRDKSLLRHHPWLFSGAVAQVENGNPEPGATVRVVNGNKEFLAYGAISPASQLRVRIWSFDESETIDADFFARRVRAAWDFRRHLGLPLNGRLVAAEADGLPGVVVDCYEDFAVLQLTAAGAECHRAELVAALQALPCCWRGIYERSDVAVRKREGLDAHTTGVLAGEEPPELLEIAENGLKFLVDVKNGHKTGFYFDQRENRALVGAVCAGKRVLNLFSYTGGFGVAAAVGGAAQVVNVDSSEAALALGARNFALNGVAAERFENVAADAFSTLRRYRGEQRQFDVIVLDPPKLVESQGMLARGTRAYKDAALQAFHLLAPGGMLFTFSCSGLVDRALFAKITADAALDAGVEGKILRELAQAADHPVPLEFPEALYLKGLQVAVA